MKRMDDTEETMRAVLDARREELHKIEGVVGSAIGLGGDDGQTVGIELFVGFNEDVGRVLREGHKIVGSLPLRVIVSGVPQAQ